MTAEKTRDLGLAGESMTADRHPVPREGVEDFHFDSAADLLSTIAVDVASHGIVARHALLGI
jgi:hypothetical protein